MLMIPIRRPEHTQDALLIVLDRKNLARMREGDPAEVKMADVADLRNPVIALCYEDDHNKLTKFIQSADIHGLIEYLHRGWKYRPEMGDHDRGPESLKDLN